VERKLAWLSYISTEVAPVDDVFSLVLEVITFLRIMAVVVMETIITPSVSFLKSGFHWVGCPEQAFLPDLEEDFSPDIVEGMVGGLGMVGSGLFVLLEDPGGGPQDDSARGRFWSSRLPTTTASATMYWLALCSISRIVTGELSTRD
ncbi:hypothetical protein BHM03_00050971, partial [Ensete ventricosum]